MWARGDHSKKVTPNSSGKKERAFSEENSFEVVNGKTDTKLNLLTSGSPNKTGSPVSPKSRDRTSTNQTEFRRSSLLTGKLNKSITDVNSVYDPGPFSRLASKNLLNEAENFRSTSDLNFRPLTDLSGLHAHVTEMQDTLSTEYPYFRYNMFLDYLGVSSRKDPVSFGDIRYECLMKYIYSCRHDKDFKKVELCKDLQYYENLLRSLMRSIRNFIRVILRERSFPEKGFKNNDELVHLNGVKYIHFLMTLPSQVSMDDEKLSICQKTTLQYKETLQNIDHCLRSLAKEKTDGAMEMHNFGYFFVQVARKVANDYTLLELYRIHIYDKLGNNSLIGTRSLQKLFGKYNSRKKENISTTVKVLHYNTHFSMFLSWWMAVRVPFVRLIEMSAYNEEVELVTNFDSYRSHEMNAQKVSFEELDIKLRNNFFEFINIPDYEVYRSLAAERLTHIQSFMQNLSSSDKNSSENLASYGCKPVNYEYSSESLRRIPSESISLITSRDLKLQLTPSSYYVILREFYRILESDGILEIPMFVTDGLESVKNGSVFQLNCCKYGDIDLNEFFDCIPNFFQVVLDELQKIFGRENVKYNVTILNKFDNLGKYLANAEAFSNMEIAGIKPVKESYEKNSPFENEVNLLVNIFAHKT